MTERAHNGSRSVRYATVGRAGPVPHQLRTLSCGTIRRQAFRTTPPTGLTSLHALPRRQRRPRPTSHEPGMTQA
ncbi:hypothetical protein [Corynebacterium matruchotii]|uniref:hypothetical protein n=1 Tax=Corynebacterium matruchotii TaxID=43768 RepID=UPI0028EFF64F|nr:hypothetical protein [Corynebacterium matruchotii]